MNPFDTPPSGSPVESPLSATPGATPIVEPPRRGRMAVVALVAAGLVGGGIAGISALASADDPEVALPAASPDGEDTGDADETTSDEATADDAAPDDADASDEPALDGELEFDLGDGEPIVIDLGDVGEETFDRLQECIGLPPIDVTFGEFGGLSELEPGDFPFDEDVVARLDELLGEFGQFEPGEFPFGDPDEIEAWLDELIARSGSSEWELGGLADGGSVTVTGPDGVSIIDLGEGGSVTVTKDDGEITIETSGDATVSDLEDLFGEFGELFPSIGPDGEFPEWFDEQQLDEWLDDLPELGELGELPDFEPIDPAEIQSCLDDVLGD